MSSLKIRVEGFAAGDPERESTKNGTPVASFSIAVTERVKQGDKYTDGETTWVRVTGYGADAEGIMADVRKGTLVVADGRARIGAYVSKKADEVRPSVDVTLGTLVVKSRDYEAQTAKAGA